MFFKLPKRFHPVLAACGLVVFFAGSATVSADDASVARGAQLFQQYCTECHGRDGRAQLDVIADATDLTDTQAYYSGFSRDEIFNSIAQGAGVAMPAWRSRLGSDEAVWDLVDFIQSLWPQ